jgi:hypothetical protein
LRHLQDMGMYIASESQAQWVFDLIDAAGLVTGGT